MTQNTDIEAHRTYTGGMTEHHWWAIVWGIFAVGVIVRLGWFGDFSFPINDGALFVVIAEAIASNGMALPTEYDFNGHTLPLGYPPLGLWLVAAISQLTGVDPVLVATWYPFATNLVFIAGFVALLRVLDTPWPVIVAATAFFVFQDRTFKFLMMGGGITRGTGAAFAIWAWVATAHALRDPRIGRLLLPMVLCGLAILSHLEFGITAATGITALVLLSDGRFADRARMLVIIGAGSFLVILPWLYWVISAHGLEPFRSASDTSGWCLSCSAARALGLGMFPYYIAIPCFLGALELARQKRHVWLVLALAIYIMTPRHAPSALVIPNSVLAAYGMFVLFRLFTEGMKAWTTPTDGTQFSALSSPLSNAVFVAVFVSAMTTVGATNEFRKWLGMETLSVETREAMAWVDRTVPENSRFVIFSGEPWATDETAEWFPYLTSSVSLSTAQGLEWAEHGVFKQKLKDIGVLTSTSRCAGLLTNTLDTFPDAEYLFAVRLRDCYDAEPRFVEIFSNGAATVYRIVSP